MLLVLHWNSPRDEPVRLADLVLARLQRYAPGPHRYAKTLRARKHCGQGIWSLTAKRFERSAWIERSGPFSFYRKRLTMHTNGSVKDDRFKRSSLKTLFCKTLYESSDRCGGRRINRRNCTSEANKCTNTAMKNGQNRFQTAKLMTWSAAAAVAITATP